MDARIRLQAAIQQCPAPPLHSACSRVACGAFGFRFPSSAVPPLWRSFRLELLMDARTRLQAAIQQCPAPPLHSACSRVACGAFGFRFPSSAVPPLWRSFRLELLMDARTRLQAAIQQCPAPPLHSACSRVACGAFGFRFPSSAVPPLWRSFRLELLMDASVRKAKIQPKVEMI